MLNHFTKELDTLNSILKDSSFRLSYCSEQFRDENEEIASKNITYGRYCISMKEQWAIKNKLNPVLYVEKNSHVALGLKKLLLERKKDTFQSNLRLPVMQIKCFTKHLKGFNSYLQLNNFDFSAEKEWRFVPQKKDINGLYISLNKSTYLKKKNLYNQKLIPYPLKFTFSDIECIFVDKEDDIKFIKRDRSEFPELMSKLKISTWKN